ncbi:MAG: RDD family protein [Pseudomonadota bacterium]
MTNGFDMSGLPDPERDVRFYERILSKRLLAWVIDFAILIVLTLIAGLFSFFALLFVLPFTMFAISTVYRALMISNYGATLGMQITNIEIRNSSGELLDQKTAWWHSGTFSAMFLIPILPIIGAIVMLTTRYKQGLHDLPFGTTAIIRSS